MENFVKHVSSDHAWGFVEELAKNNQSSDDALLFVQKLAKSIDNGESSKIVIREHGACRNISLQIKSSTGKIKDCEIANTTCLQILMIRYCAQMGFVKEKMRFVFNGRLIEDLQTPHSLRMKTGNVINVMPFATYVDQCFASEELQRKFGVGVVGKHRIAFMIENDWDGKPARQYSVYKSKRLQEFMHSYCDAHGRRKNEIHFMLGRKYFSGLERANDIFESGTTLMKVYARIDDRVASFNFADNGGNGQSSNGGSKDSDLACNTVMDLAQSSGQSSNGGRNKNAAQTATRDGSLDDWINVWIVGHEFKISKQWYRQQKKRPLINLMRDFCKLNHCDPRDVRFLFQDSPVLDTQTPDDLKMNYDTFSGNIITAITCGSHGQDVLNGGSRKLEKTPDDSQNGSGLKRSQKSEKNDDNPESDCFITHVTRTDDPVASLNLTGNDCDNDRDNDRDNDLSFEHQAKRCKNAHK
jgi:hypothetical protein